MILAKNICALRSPNILPVKISPIVQMFFPYKGCNGKTRILPLIEIKKKKKSIASYTKKKSHKLFKGIKKMYPKLVFNQ